MAANSNSVHNCTEPFGVVFMLGGPGSGKGTICPPIASHFNMIHLSAGELLRKELNTPNSKFSAVIESHMKGGTIVPVAITCSLLHKVSFALSILLEVMPFKVLLTLHYITFTLQYAIFCL
ncbi:unnamed protein product [Hydatigera taeniaeformis]|uniref:Adenylate kinase n=1 Tax=Hydatigena taeniaeformis TaxID=6205 RepID=A0A0R3WU82_HYDTA|nr:unnamed protein product [Hydatigera taeniaeformis]